MDTDDRQIGRILSRRQALAVLGAGGLAALAAACSGKNASYVTTPDGAAATVQPTVAQTNSAPGAAASTTTVPACVVRPALTEGPYFVDEKLNRADIRSDPTNGSVKPGIPLTLTFNVASVANNACGGLAGATIDAWH